MRLVNASEMKTIEEQAMNIFGLTPEFLMENAANAAVRYLFDQWGPGPARAGVFCGKGNNGGDGWAVARLLFEQGWEVKVFHPGRNTPLTVEAALNRQRALTLGIPDAGWSDAPAAIDEFDVVIDALLGTGIRDGVSGELARVIEVINGSGKPVLSLDIPSGVSGDTGRVVGPAVRADWTISFGCLKLGQVVFPGREYCGKVKIDPIGIPQRLLVAEGPRRLTEAADVAGWLPKRQWNSHKGQHGHLLVIGGSPGLTGAPVLAALAGLRSGAGLVTIGHREGLVFLEKPAEVMTGEWSGLAWENYRAMVVGPGLGQAREATELLAKVLAKRDLPRVIDADGLNLLAAAGVERHLREGCGPLILTPHPGELARLCGLTAAEVQADRVGLALEKAKAWGVILVLKGAGTLTATPDGRLWVNPTGNPGLATAGTGDVLAGVIGGLLAQGLSAEEAAVAGVYLHGAAGDCAAEELGEVGMIAGDLLPRLPKVIRSVKQVGPI